MARGPGPEWVQGAARTTENQRGRREECRVTKAAGRPKSWDRHDMLGVLTSARLLRALEPTGGQDVSKDEATMIGDLAPDLTTLTETVRARPVQRENDLRQQLG